MCKIRSFGSGLLGLGLILATTSNLAWGQACVVPDNGSGTVNLPPIGGPGCGYLSPNDVHEIIAGLPPGTTVILGAAHSRFANVVTTPGGPLGGEREQFNSEILLELHGTGELAGYSRFVNMFNVNAITDTAPRGTGTPQVFATDMFAMQGQLPAGDPDFDLLRITAGTSFGMPSPGQTTLTRLGPPGSNWQVDSFFDITYRIDFVGRPGGPLGGHSGSTTGTIRMQTGLGGSGAFGCCLPMGMCVMTSSVASCFAQGGSPLAPGVGCAGDLNGDGIDEACFSPPCVQCGPGPHWIHNPPCPPGGSGQDTLPSGAVLGIDTNFDCVADTNVVAFGPVTIGKRGPFDDASNFPGTRPIDGHLDVIDTEIIGMSLTGGGVTLKAGTMSGSLQPLNASRGAVAEQPGNPSLADSFFDVFFEIEYAPGIYGYNQTPVHVAQIIECMPPKDNYYHLGGCLPLYNSPALGTGIHIANLVQANHFTYPACCSTALPGGCAPNIPASQCQGTIVPACLGDSNGNGQDDACDPQCDRDPTSPTGCSPLCPPPVGTGDQCLPQTAGCNPHEPGSCGVLSCDCQNPSVCHLEKDLATGAYQCVGGCPVPPGGTCTLLGDGAFDNPFRCECVGSPPCVPNAAATDCENALCGTATERCQKKCVKIDADGNIEVTDCECEPQTNCHVETHQGPVPRSGMDGGVAGGPNGCIVPDNGGGTVTLPPAGCDYLSPDDVHMIIDGLPPNTTLELQPIHLGIFCREQNNVCSFPPGVDCSDAGGMLGGEKECNASQLHFQLACVATGPGGCPGTLNGWTRPVVLPDVGFETHVAPRNPGDPVQSFDTNMFRLFGQISNPSSGDPDFDLLRVVAGTDFGLPSPGHTTLTKLPGGNWAVDSFFDITYRIDFVGRPGGHLGGMSGSTTGTIRMQTTPPVKCTGDCPAGTVCQQTNVPQPDGTNKICCDCVTIPPPVCEALPDASGCTTTCPNPALEQCLPVTGGCNINQPGTCGILSCDCQDPNVCHLVRDATGYHCVGGCPVPPGGTCTLMGTGGFGDPYHCECGGATECAPNSTGTDCQPFQCPASPTGPEVCRKKCVSVDIDGNVTVVDCNCQTDQECYMELSTTGGRVAGASEVDGGVAGGPSGCFEPDAGGTVILPPPGLDCPYVSPNNFHQIIAGLPTGTTVQVGIEHARFINITNQPGGNLGGERETFGSTLTLVMNGQCSGPPNPICGYSRTLQIMPNCETHIGPRTPGNPVQSFDTDMFMLQGQLPPGDPDFDLLRVTAGTGFGMPSPGHTTLTLMPDGQWAVDSFFDITYRIDFVGAAGGPFAGMSGSTTGTIRMELPTAFKCRGDCPPGTQCVQTSTPEAGGSKRICCECVQIPQVCEPNATGTDCNPVMCPPDPQGLPQVCRKKCVKVDAVGNVQVVDCDCQPEQDCHVELSGAGGRGVALEVDGGVAGGPNGCIVPDDGGTVDLPPVGCDYLSPDDVHMIIDGLPPGTTINLAPIHKDFICHQQPGGSGVCSFPQNVECEESGGSLGGEKECSNSTIQFNANCVGPGCNGFGPRTIQIPLSFETHIAPRTVGDPVQSFDTDMFRLFGQITGDPDFDLLRIVGGTDFGLPSPGHTTLTQLPGGNWAVDSFFDITYRIDFVGHPGGPLGGMSGSTTGTIRMQTGAPFKCRGDCPPGTRCVQTSTPEPDGTKRICCDCIEDEPQGACCTFGAAGNICVNTTQSQCNGTFLPGQICSGIMVACCLPNGSCAQMDEVCCAASGGISLVGVTCTGPQACCFQSGVCQNLDPACCQAQGGTPLGAGSSCLGDLDGNGADDACERCEPTPDGHGCTNLCPPGPVNTTCHQRCARLNPQTQAISITDCDCRGQSACHLVYLGGGIPRGLEDEVGIIAGGADACIVPDNGSGTVTLPPPGCDYLSPDEVHMILDGLPAGTTLNLAPIHTQIFCREQNSVCSFPPGVDCTDAGGTLGGEKECNGSALVFQASCSGACPGGLAGWNRTITLPNVGFETHTAPRTPGHGIQSFDTQMFRMFGQLPPGDPDFDLLRVTAGTDFGMPSPGHTTLTRLGPPGSNWAVDSFFDITYRIDFVGRAGGPLAGMSGSTTATIRMQTKAPFKCVGGCGPRRSCTPRVGYNADGTVNICCDCRPRLPLLDPTSVNKSRFISFAIDTGSLAGGAPEENAIRVRLVSLHHVTPPYTGGPSIPFTAFEGQVRYAGPPAVYLETVNGDTRFIASHLSCTPHYRDWSSFNTCSLTPTICTVDADCPMGGTCTVPVGSLLHVTGSAIPPSSVFEVEVLGSSCMGMENSCEDVSDPLELKTARWGDVEVPYNPPSTTTQPDLADVSALVNKFRNAPGAPIKARSLLVGGDLFGSIDISTEFSFIHIAACVDAFRGRPYPHQVQACP